MIILLRSCDNACISLYIFMNGRGSTISGIFNYISTSNVNNTELFSAEPRLVVIDAEPRV